ncbi:hypothetical protein GBAR_LOCUS29567 [Geodia barretti]|uniref:Uncharacterized protein n=1 Tax=Geodia barretti TaxID=519541 RepID=A0AA35TTE6_GEOBA|nr:hypothetical protein GBAR_LOCUS29567 [Geodia barretti]
MSLFFTHWKMSASLGVLCILVFASGTPKACSEYVKTDHFYAELQPRGNIMTFVGNTINFICSTNLPATFSHWEINNKMYNTYLPPGFIARGPNIEVTFQTNVIIRCFFKVSLNGSIINIFSNAAIVLSLDTVLQHYRGVRESFFCEKANVTFANDMEVSRIHVGSVSTGDNCKLLISISRCGDTGLGSNVVLEVPATESNIIATFDSVEMFYDHDVTVAIDNDCDFCGETYIYIPNMKTTESRYIPSQYTGTIIEDLTNDYCDFNSFVIEYRICVYSGGTNECFEDPCGNGEIYTSRCGTQNFGAVVSLETNGVENGTIISIFCFGIDCRGNPSNVMVFNVIIGDIYPVSVINTTHGSKSTSTSSLWYNSYQTSVADIRLRLTPATSMALSNSLVLTTSITTAVKTSPQEHQDIICNH